MKKSKYKILVLSDLKNSSKTLLKSTVCLAKMIHGEIDFFHVKKPTEIVERESQLSAFRTINGAHYNIDKKIQNLLNPISKDYGININYKFTFGHIKNEINDRIEAYQPDIIVIGKRKSKPLSFIGDNMASFILKKHKGIIMIAADEFALEPNKEVSLGFLNNMGNFFNTEFSNALMQQTQKPLKSFKIVNKSKTLKEEQVPTDKKTIEYIFEKGDNTITTLSNYISKNNINLLCVNRATENTENEGGFIKTDIKDVISNLNVSLLLTGAHKSTTLI